MPSNKSFYEGSVILDNTIDNLDLSGWINRKLAEPVNKGAKSIRLNIAHTFTKGDVIIEALTNRFIGRFKEQDGGNSILERPVDFAMPTNRYLRVRPRFEIVKIEIIGFETYISELVPVDRKHPGSLLPDRDTWASNTAADFGAQDGDGVVLHSTLGAIPEGTIIEGRFQRVVIDNTNTATNHAAICYLKSAPTIM